MGIGYKDRRQAMCNVKTMRIAYQREPWTTASTLKPTAYSVKPLAHSPQLLAYILKPIAYSLILLFSITPVVQAQLTAENVRRAIRRGADFLKSQQNKMDGSWPEHPGQPGGLTGLVTLALLTAGESPDSPEVQAALNYLRSVGEPSATYAVSLQTMVFCMAQPDKDRALISRNVDWLESQL